MKTLEALDVKQDSILVRLKNGTRAEHESVEKRFDLLSRTQDLARYRSLLEIFWGFFQPMEDRIFAVTGMQSFLPDLQSRLRARSLQKDLVQLGRSSTDIQHLAQCMELPPVDSPAQAFGCLYVMEGSTLGGQMIARAVKAGPPIISSACSFFESYGSRVSFMWKTFADAAEMYASRNPADREVICASASRTFRSLDTWIEVCDTLQSRNHG